MITMYVGEQPVENLTFVIRDEAGAPRDLRGYSSVETVQSAALPAHTTSFSDAEHGKVAINFGAPFTEAGLYALQFKLIATTGETGQDYTVFFDIRVLDNASLTEAAMVTPAQAYAVTGQAVGPQDLAAAQLLIEMVVARDLSSTSYVAGLSDRVQRLLRQAISWQAVHEQAQADTPAPIYPAGAVSVTTGKQTISFGSSGATANDVSNRLSPLALLALRGVGNASGARSIAATPMLADAGAYRGVYDDGTGQLRVPTDDRLWPEHHSAGRL